MELRRRQRRGKFDDESKRKVSSMESAFDQGGSFSTHIDTRTCSGLEKNATATID